MADDPNPNPPTPPADPKTPPTPPADDKPDDVEALKKHNKALLTELSNKKTDYKTVSEELASLKAEKEKAEREKLEKNGENEKLYQLEKQQRQSMQQQLIRAELKAQAAKEGIIDLDAVALIPTDKLKLNESTMEVSGIEDAVKAFKESKPYLFQKSDPTPPASPPANGKPGPTGAPVVPPAPANADAKITDGIKPGSMEGKKVVADWKSKFR